MKKVSLIWWAPFALGMGMFSWLMFSGPTGLERAKAGPPAAIPGYFPLISREASLRLARVNAYRIQANVPALSEDADWSDGAYQHARYMVKTDQLVTTEDRVAFPQWYTDPGNTAASRSLLLVTDTVTISDDALVDFWMRGPFQALSLLDPELRTSGWGAYREADGGVQTAAVLNVLSGWQSGAVAGTTFPIVWPGQGSTVRLRSYSGADDPNPLLAPNCAGAQGLPLLVQWGDGALTGEHLAAVNPTVIMAAGGPVPHCAFSATEYPANAADGNYGKLLLDTRDAVVLMPLNPLSAGATYTVSVAALVNTTPYNVTWSFTVAPDAAP